MNENIREHITMLERRWRPFLEKLADTVHPPTPERLGWTPENESWLKLVNHLDGIAAAYVAWQGAGISVNEHGAVDDARILELIQPCGLSEADQRVFVSACRQGLRDWRKLHPNLSTDAEDEDDGLV